MNHLTITALFSMVGGLLLSGCSSEKPTPGGGTTKAMAAAYAGDAKGLEKLMKDLLVAQRDDPKKAAELTRGLLPDRSRVA